MLKVRKPACATVAGPTEVRTGFVAKAVAGVILSAICAMKVPSPIMIAAKIIMLRMTPLSTAVRADFIMAAKKLRPMARRVVRNLGEKGERRVNEGYAAGILGVTSPSV
jgi:hypothetical protein